MKIGIITFWQSKDNYGQLLQCWALQEYLKKQGHEPFLIRYDFINNIHRTSTVRKIAKLLLIYPIVAKVLSTINLRKYKRLQEDNRIKNKKRLFDDFVTKYITVSDRLYRNLSELQHTPPSAECYITGSDQVWAQKLDYEDNKAFFLNFGGNNVRRIAYAPSFAMKSYPRKLLPSLKQALSTFDFISVRESDGCKICASVGAEATKVLDPTLLLDKSDYIRFLDSTPSSVEHVFIYSINILSAAEIRWNELQSYIQSKKYRVIVTPASGYVPGAELFGSVCYSYATIQNWLSNIYYAKLVVTTSFHGVVFCILFRKPFVFVPLKGKYSSGNNRIFELLDELGLSSRILNDNSGYQDIISKPIDWESVSLLLEEKREASFTFLYRVLL